MDVGRSPSSLGGWGNGHSPFHPRVGDDVNE
jgi:hypothetical protein